MIEKGIYTDLEINADGSLSVILTKEGKRFAKALLKSKILTGGDKLTNLLEYHLHKRIIK
jgi:hypothetical protein